MTFTKDEQKKLERLGLQVINPVVAVQDGWTYQVHIEKMGSNEFDVNIDVIVDQDDEDSDLIRANGNRTETQLTFDEVIELLQEGYLE